MKRRSFFLPGIALVLLCVACEKKLESAKPTLQEVTERMYNSENFTVFAKRFLADFKNMADYYHLSGVQKNRGAFTGSLKDAGDDDTKTESAFAAYSLPMDELLTRKNRVDNDLLELFNKEKILLKYNETEVWTIIRGAIDMGWQSQSSVWQDVRNASAVTALSVRTNGDGAGKQVNKIVADEIWGCLKEAVGVGSASVLGIAGLQKLASEGIQAAVITLSKWLAKRAGWIGAIIMVADFSSCMYHEWND